MKSQVISGEFEFCEILFKNLNHFQICGKFWVKSPILTRVMLHAIVPLLLGRCLGLLLALDPTQKLRNILDL